MRHINIFRAFLLFVLFTFFMTSPSALAEDEPDTITGTVIAMNWDDDDNVTVIAIATETEDILVSDSPKGAELFELIDHVVEATGKITLNEENVKTIVVSTYKDLGAEEENKIRIEEEPESK